MRTVAKRSIRVHGHSTSVSLEPKFWDLLKRIADMSRVSVQSLVEEIDKHKGESNLSSAIRVFVLEKLEASL